MSRSMQPSGGTKHCPTSFRCEPVDPPEPGTVIKFFQPFDGGGFGEPLKLGGGGKKPVCTVCDLREPHTHMDDSLVRLHLY